MITHHTTETKLTCEECILFLKTNAVPWIQTTIIANLKMSYDDKMNAYIDSDDDNGNFKNVV